MAGSEDNSGGEQSSQRRIPANAWATPMTFLRNVETPPDSEFSIQNEDFPALPGTATSNSDLTSAPVPVNTLSQAAEMLVTAGQQQPEREPSDDRIITHPNGEVTNIPPSLMNDQFGMVGLLVALRVITKPELVSLSVGYDCTMVGLNLALPVRDLYKTFGGPLANRPIRAHEQDAKVPEEYMVYAHIRERLPMVKFHGLQEDTLFFLFYNFTSEYTQVAASIEIDWRYHKVEKVWLTRSKDIGAAKEQTGTYERGQYLVFDSTTWRKIPREMKVEYKDLEDMPRMSAYYQSHGLGPFSGLQ